MRTGLSARVDDAPLGYFTGMSVRWPRARMRSAQHAPVHEPGVLFGNTLTGGGGVRRRTRNGTPIETVALLLMQGQSCRAVARAVPCNLRTVRKLLRHLQTALAPLGRSVPRPVRTRRRFRSARTGRLRGVKCKCGRKHFCKGKCRSCYMKRYNAARREPMRVYNAARPHRQRKAA